MAVYANIVNQKLNELTQSKDELFIEIRDLKNLIEETMDKMTNKMEELEKKTDRNESNIVIISNFIKA